jgi:CcmD family protein
MKNLSYLFAAYTIIWVVIFGYILNLSRKNRELGREIGALKERLPAKK